MPGETISASPYRSPSTAFPGLQSHVQMANTDGSGKHTREPIESHDAETPFVFLDMGAYNLPAFPELSQHAPGSPALQGLQIMQLLPRALLGRASYFVPFSGAAVSP